MNRVTFALVGLTAAAGLALVAWMVGGGPAGATHWIPYKYTWMDLVPRGDRHLIYSPCAYDGAPSEWAQGVENWDAAMSTLMEFDNVGCGYAQVTLVWEGGAGEECGPGVYACWVPLIYSDHDKWRELTTAAIYFDRSKYSGLSSAWKTAVSAHEWGHNLNLADHPRENQCDVYLIMAENNDHSRPLCLTGPSPAEADSVAQFYGYWGPADPDEDGFSNDVENWVATDPLDDCPDDLGDAAWPPDIDNDADADIVDVLRFKPYILTSVPPSPRRFDLDADGDIDIVDVLKYKPIILTHCTNP